MELRKKLECARRTAPGADGVQSALRHKRRDTAQQEGTANGREREGAHMTWHEAANAATPDQKAVHSILALLACMFHDAAMLELLGCAAEARSLGGRRGTAQRHNRAAAWAMHAMC